MQHRFYTKKRFAEISKNLVRYRSENNFVELSKYLCRIRKLVKMLKFLVINNLSVLHKFFII